MTLTFAMAVWEKGSIAESSLEVQIAMGLCPPPKNMIVSIVFFIAIFNSGLVSMIHTFNPSTFVLRQGTQ